LIAAIQDSDVYCSLIITFHNRSTMTYYMAKVVIFTSDCTIS